MDRYISSGLHQIYVSPIPVLFGEKMPAMLCMTLKHVCKIEAFEHRTLRRKILVEIFNTIYVMIMVVIHYSIVGYSSNEIAHGIPVCISKELFRFFYTHLPPNLLKSEVNRSFVRLVIYRYATIALNGVGHEDLACSYKRSRKLTMFAIF